jgi:hypothetical protein
MRDYDELLDSQSDACCVHCGANLVPITTSEELAKVYTDHDIAHGSGVPKEKLKNGWLHEPFSVDPKDLHTHDPEPTDEFLSPEEQSRRLNDLGSHEAMQETFRRIVRGIGQQFKDFT